MLGRRKVVVCFVSLGCVLLLALAAGILDLSDSVVVPLAGAITWISVGFAGGNGLEHLAAGVSGRVKGPRVPRNAGELEG